ncbi:hypothetical protein F0562_023386 [Nyssa sinensis]|uniref:Uncharacterized protein n=1 Tax=Nyssa sinensis TaxID=561372 RepID=A0A5J5BIM4_9ASTE|nr:hypothetical protein F0562_023386 [Nyssa sinensis]
MRKRVVLRGEVSPKRIVSEELEMSPARRETPTTILVVGRAQKVKGKGATLSSTLEATTKSGAVVLKKASVDMKGLSSQIEGPHCQETPQGRDDRLVGGDKEGLASFKEEATLNLKQSVEAARVQIEKDLKGELDDLGANLIDYGYRLCKKKLLNLFAKVNTSKLDVIEVPEAEIEEEATKVEDPVVDPSTIDQLETATLEHDTEPTSADQYDLYYFSIIKQNCNRKTLASKI